MEILKTVGELGVPLFDFYIMTWKEWCYYSAGLLRSKTLEWEHTRTIAWLIYKANSDPKKSAKTMQSWMPLSTDVVKKITVKKVKGKRLTKKQITNFFNSMR